jgi:hypothetical protein
LGSWIHRLSSFCAGVADAHSKLFVGSSIIAPGPDGRDADHLEF